jgi:plastocyanin
MDKRDESLLPETGNVQSQHYALRHSSRTGFVYSRERVNKADVRSLDRVWDRLEEHVTRNSAAYRTNRNVPALRTNASVSGVESEPQAYPQKGKTFHHRLNMLAAACVLLLVVGSLILVFHTVRQVGSGTTTGSKGQVTPSSLVVAGKIFIIQGKKGTEFNPSLIKVPAGSAILLGNNTDKIQVVILDRNSTAVILASKASVLLPVGKAGDYIWHLKANPSARVNVIVFGIVPPLSHMITIVLSKAGNAAEFDSNKLILKVGAIIVWMNGTAQTQVIIGDSNGQNITLEAKGSAKVAFSKAGTYVFHLESNAGAQTVIIVEN